MTGLRVEFTLSGRWVAPTYPLHLDALLAYVEFQKTLEGLEPDSKGGIKSLRAQSDDALGMYLDRYEKDGKWVYKASALQNESEVMNHFWFYTRRVPWDDYSIKVGEGLVFHKAYTGKDKIGHFEGIIDKNRRHFRNLLGFYPTQLGMDGTIKLVSWCVGDKDSITEALTEEYAPTHIGHRRRAGFGKILKTEIIEDDTALENWKLRVKPWPLLKDERVIQANYQAPYWDLNNATQAYMPNMI